MFNSFLERLLDGVVAVTLIIVLCSVSVIMATLAVVAIYTLQAIGAF